MRVTVARPAGEPHCDAVGSAAVRNLEIDPSPDLLVAGDLGRWFDGLHHLRDERANSIATQLARELSIREASYDRERLYWYILLKRTLHRKRMRL